MIVEMKRCDLIVHAGDVDRIVEDIAWLGAIEIKTNGVRLEFPPNDPDGEETEVLSLSGFESNTKPTAAELRATLAVLESAVKNLAPFDKEKKKMFASRPLLKRASIDAPSQDYFDAVKSAVDAGDCFKAQNDYKTEKNRLDSLRLSLEPWRDCDLPLGFAGTAKSIVVFGTVSVLTGDASVREEIGARDLAAEFIAVGKDTENIYAVIVCHADDESDLDAALNKTGFMKANFLSSAAIQGSTAAEKISELDRRSAALAAKISDADSALSALALQIPQMKVAYDITAADIVKAELKESFLATESSAFIQGYIPAKKTAELETIADKYACCLDIFDVPLDDPEDIPILLENKKLVEPFESVLGLYSYPLYTGLDPTLIMSIFYFVIFGLMFGDFFYGLILTVGGYAFLKLAKPKKGMRQLISVFAICGVSCMICGILFGGYFGDMPSAIAQNLFGKPALNQAIIFDPLANPIGYLAISMGVGFIHIFTGMGIKMYTLIKRGEVLDAVFGIGMWYLIFGGIGLYFITPAGIWVTVAGIVGMALMKEHTIKNPIIRVFKGLFGLYDIISYLADVLSYARILALGLSGAVIAMVVNLLGTMAGAPAGFFTLILATAVGHSLNMALSLLGAFVHAARLQYIEFFGKFYEDGGRPFSPAAFDATYSDIATDSE